MVVDHEFGDARVGHRQAPGIGQLAGAVRVAARIRNGADELAVASKYFSQ